MKKATMSFIEHLEELRIRLIKSALAVVCAAVCVYFFNDRILAVLAQPVGKLVFISPTEAFMSYLKLSIWGGLFLASPVVIYQVWGFLSSGLKTNEKKWVYLFMPASFLLFVTGMSFAFFVIIRYGIHFLLSFGTASMTPMITISKYISFLGATCLGFGIVFQLPLVLFFLTKVGLVTPSFLAQKRRHALVIIFIAAGALTPGPDIFSQLSMALPLFFLYELGILLSRMARSAADKEKNIIEKYAETSNATG